MIKAVMHDENGRLVLLIGLSFNNLRRFMAEPGETFIMVKGTETGLDDAGCPMDVVIFSGRTEEEMGRIFADKIGPDTKMHIDPRLGS